MKKQDKTLFQIGEVTKILGVTRKSLLVLENMGLVIPAVKNEDSGYRYYSADNIMQIRSVRSLQKLGLTLKEVAAYYYDIENIDTYLQNLMELRASLDRNIQMLQARTAKHGDFSVHKTILPYQACFCQRYRCQHVTEATGKLRNTYIAALQTEKNNVNQRMFTMRMSQSLENREGMDMMCCIPVDSSYHGPERVEFPETPALCIYYRGPYEKLVDVMHTLMDYVKKNNIEIAGSFRCVYLEGPPNHGANSNNYVTQVAVPVKKFED